MQATTGPVISPPVGAVDEEALRRARSGDAGAFSAIAASRLAGCFRFACAILGSEADAADATQNALVAAWHALPRLEDPARFDPWLRRILLNECRMRLRVRATAPSVPVAESQLSSPAGDQWDLDRSRALDLLERAFESLDAEDRTILVLHHLEDVPLAELADLLHMPAGTVKWRHHEGRAALVRGLDTDA